MIKRWLRLVGEVGGLGLAKMIRWNKASLRVVGTVLLGLGAVLVLWWVWGVYLVFAGTTEPGLEQIVVLADPGDNPLDLVINEVAWMGTVASTSDEWIELRNNTAVSISLSGWKLIDGGDINVALTGVISPYGYYLLERSNDSTISDTIADQIYTGGLNNAGEILTLTNGSGIVIDVVDARSGWPAGNSTLRQSMERIDSLAGSGDDNWVTNSGVYRNGLDENGNPVYGTPRQLNSSERNRGQSGEVLIAAIHYDGYQSNDLDEGFQLINVSTRTITLTGWTVSDNAGTFAFSSTLAFAPGQTIWCARQSPSFTLSFGFSPDFEYSSGNIVGNVPNLGTSDYLVIKDTAGTVIDAVVWGSDAMLNGWSGPALQRYANGVFATSGQILFRKRSEQTGLPLPDTNAAADWANDTTPGAALYGPVREGDLWGKRVSYPGWDWEAYTRTLQISATANVTVGIAPDNAYTVVAELLRSAQDYILVEGYTWESVWLTGILTERIGAGVQVTILLEGAPAGGLPDGQLWNCQQIVDAGGAVYFMHNDDAARIDDRYANQHAKLIVVDGRQVLVGSENFGNHAMPVDDKSNGTQGNRGVILITDQPTLIEYAEALFARDLDLAHPDIVPYGSLPRYTVPLTYTAVYSPGGGFEYPALFSPTCAFQADWFEVVQSPETSLRLGDGLIALVLRAGPGDEVYVEQMYERLRWGRSSSTPADDPNPRLEAYIQAARQGAAVRIILDKGFDDGGQNLDTAWYVMGIAEAEGLDIEVRRGDPTYRGIHNKMVLVRLGSEWYSHVGSINGSESSSKINRELALQVRSQGIYDYLKQVFDYDWAHSSGIHEVYLPIVMKSYVPEANYVLISEVVFNPPGADDMGEWIELYNPTAQAVDLSGWHLGDAVNSADYERLYVFPSGTSIPAGGTLVVARQAAAYQALNYPGKPLPDFEWNNSSGSVPDLIPSGWGAGEFALGNAGDEVLLLDPARKPVDVLVYGTGSYGGVVSFGDVGGLFAGSSLERWPANRDSNDCARDFRSRSVPQPGAVNTN